MSFFKLSKSLGSQNDKLFVVGESLVDDLTDAGVQTLELFELGSDVRRRRFSREDTHEPREKTVYHADDTRVGTVHAGGNAALKRLEARQDHLLPLQNSVTTTLSKAKIPTACDAVTDATIIQALSWPRPRCLPQAIAAASTERYK